MTVVAIFVFSVSRSMALSRLRMNACKSLDNMCKVRMILVHSLEQIGVQHQSDNVLVFIVKIDIFGDFGGLFLDFSL